MFYLTLLALILIGAGLVLYKKTHATYNSVEDFPMEDFVVLEIKVPKILDEDFNTGPLSAEHMFASLHGLLKETPSIQEHVSFELFSDGANGIVFYCSVPRSVKGFVESQIYAQYSSSQIIKLAFSRTRLDTATAFTRLFWRGT